MCGSSPKIPPQQVAQEAKTPASMDTRRKTRDTFVPPSTVLTGPGGANALGANTDGSKGNFLVDDPQVDTIATSDSVRGEQFSVMLFGNTANPGEHVAIGSVKGTMQVVGGKRRAGRTGTV